MRRAIFVLLLCAGCASHVAAGPAACPASSVAAIEPLPKAPPADPLNGLSNEQLARKIMVMTGGARLGQQTLDAMVETFRKMPNLPPGFLDELKRQADPQELVELVIPIYVKHYDRATMLAMVHFYASAEGQAMLAKLPLVTADSIVAGREWGRTLAERTLRSLKPQASAP